MGFDLSGVAQQAKEFTEKSGNGFGDRQEYKYKILYPGIGETKVKLLFNPVSNSICRIINRHKIGDEQIPCLRTWNKSCPICDTLEDIKNINNIDLYQMKSKFRGLSFAQLVGTTAQIYENGPAKGDVIILMYPYTIYKEIQNILSTAKNEEDLAKIISSDDSYLISISHDPNHNYSAQLIPFETFKTCNSEEEFDQLLMGLDNLNEVILPSALTKEIDDKVSNVAAEMRSRYLSDNTQPKYINDPVSESQVTNLADQTPASSNTPSQPTRPMQSKPDEEIPFDAAPSSGGDRPTCYGSYGSVDKNQCMLCPMEFDCKDESGK